MNHETTHPTHDARRETRSNNPWYTDDQFDAQLSSPGARVGIEWRWHTFERAITTWRAEGSDAAGRLTILDAGCGDGLNLAALGEIARLAGAEADLYGCDYNELRLGRARATGSVRGLFLASLLDVPVADGAFDIILCSHVLEHIEDDARALNELYRSLKPKGLLIVGVPNEGCLLARLRNHAIQPSIRRTTDHVHFFTSASLLRRLKTAGFAARGLVREGFFVPHLRLSGLLQSSPAGRAATNLARVLFPSQAAGLICFVHRP